MPKAQGSQTFTVPETEDQYAPERLTLGARQAATVLPEDFLGVSFVIEEIPAGASAEIWLPKLAGDVPDPDDDYFFSGEAATSGVKTIALASWPGGAQIRVKSGGAAGSAVVHGVAD
jgi:hypothetical protein